MAISKNDSISSKTNFIGKKMIKESLPLELKAPDPNMRMTALSTKNRNSPF